MKNLKSIYPGLIAPMFAAVLLASASTSALGLTPHQQSIKDKAYLRHQQQQNHWHPYSNGIEYFFMCTIGQKCEGSQWPRYEYGL